MVPNIYLTRCIKAFVYDNAAGDGGYNPADSRKKEQERVVVTLQSEMVLKEDSGLSDDLFAQSSNRIDPTKLKGMLPNVTDLDGSENHRGENGLLI